MTTKAKRDLAADLALCEAATPGPWDADGEWVFEGDGFIMGDTIAEVESREIDARFIAEAREGWPYAIRRAISAEAEVAKLRAELKAENLRAAEWEGAALGCDEENALLRVVIDRLVDHVREVTALIIPEESAFKCDYRREWALSELAEIYSEVPDDAAETDE